VSKDRAIARTLKVEETRIFRREKVGGVTMTVPANTQAVFAAEPLPDEHCRAAFRAILAKTSELKLASLEDVLLGDLDARACATLETLSIVGASKLSLPAFVFPKLHTIRADEAKLTLASSQLPQLERLTAMLDGTRSWRELSSFTKLWGLQVGPVTDEGARSLEGLPLEILIFRRGAVGDLSVLRRFPRLTEFGAILCQEIRDLSPLADVPALTDLTLHACAHLEKVDALLELPNLRRIIVWDCRDPSGVLLRVVRLLRGRGVEVHSELDA
jgi:hypothetical protein